MPKGVIVQMMEAPDMHFIEPPTYLQALKEGIPRAKQRVIIHAMDIRWGAMLETLVPLLIEAAGRGVDVRIVGDAYSRFKARTPRSSHNQSASWPEIKKLSDRLRQSGAQVVYTGKLGLNPFARRTHSKITLVDDQIFTFGGVNFTDVSFGDKDYMLEMRDPILADRLYRLVRAIEKDEPQPLPDLEEQLGGNAALLFDGGTPKQSVIYETACKLVENAKKVYYVSQMCPSGRLAKHIKATDYECYFIHPHQTDFPANLALVGDKFKYKIRNNYTGSRYIHAKFILTEGKNGSKHIVSGSNNFSWRGVKYGTREIAVHSTDERLWQDFYNFLQKTIKES
jgi:hypothetical protein